MFTALPAAHVTDRVLVLTSCSLAPTSLFPTLPRDRRLPRRYFSMSPNRNWRTWFNECWRFSTHTVSKEKPCELAFFGLLFVRFQLEPRIF
jgi:hypothetical protein